MWWKKLVVFNLSNPTGHPVFAFVIFPLPILKTPQFQKKKIFLSLFSLRWWVSKLRFDFPLTNLYRILHLFFLVPHGSSGSGVVHKEIWSKLDCTGLALARPPLLASLLGRWDFNFGGQSVSSLGQRVVIEIRLSYLKFRFHPCWSILALEFWGTSILKAQVLMAHKLVFGWVDPHPLSLWQI